ncbi:MAG: prepilin peptidase [Acidobacteria bacterium]|nr:prepilin peptidase [Acidobacteriota bacterium]
MAWWTQPFVMLYIFVFGAAVGSFLNVVIYRLPREKSLVRPRSACPACGALIRWFDNIPVLSWLALRGRCRSCDAPISVRYPLVEVAAGAFAVLALWRWGISLVAAEVVVFAWISLVLGLIDLDFQILPDVLTYPSILLGLTASWFGGYTWWLDSVLGAIIGAVLPVTVIVLYRLLRGVEGMGWGDVKYLAAIGSVVGLQGCVGVLVVAATLGAAVGIGLILSGRGSGKTALPFGTFLALAVIFWLYAPASWLAWRPL